MELFRKGHRLIPSLFNRHLLSLRSPHPGPSTIEGSSEPALFTIKRTGPNTDSLLVSYRMSGSAVDGVDYKKLTGSAAIPAGAASVDVPVVAVDDKIAEVEEKAVLTLVPPIRPLIFSGVVITLLDYEVADPASASVSIKDNDAGVNLPTISIAATLPEASEQGPKNGEFTVSRFGGTDAALTVEYEIVTHSITWPVDGLVNAGPMLALLLVPAGERQKLQDPFWLGPYSQGRENGGNTR